MRIWKIAALMFVFAAGANAQYTSPAIDFFMHDEFYDAFLRDYSRFEEPKPLRIEYLYANWLDSVAGADEYRDCLHLASSLPVYRPGKMMVDAAFQYSRAPIWAETEEATFGSSINVLDLHLIARWTIADRLKSITGCKYSLKGDGENFKTSEPSGRKICLLEEFLSYDLHTQLNLVAGARFDRYYYDTHEDPDTSVKLADRLYCHPAIMLNWHPSDSFIVLLGIPGMGAHLSLGDVLKAEARVSIDRKAEIAFRMQLLERTNATLRFLNTPYMEIPIKGSSLHAVGARETLPLLAERLCYTSKSFLLEIGRELNPAALASLCIRYSPGGDVELKDRSYKDSITLDGKPHFAIGATFTVDIEVLAGIR